MVELPLDLGPALGQLLNSSALLPTGALDVPVHACQLELKTLDFEQLGPGGLAARFHIQLGDQGRQLRVALRQPSARVGEVPTQVLGGSPHSIAREMLAGIKLGEGPRTLVRARDAEGQKCSLGAFSARGQG
jgi:hypothetical protein